MVDLFGDGFKASKVNLGSLIVAGVGIDQFGNDWGVWNTVIEVNQNVDQLAVGRNQSWWHAKGVVIHNLFYALDISKLVR